MLSPLGRSSPRCRCSARKCLLLVIFFFVVGALTWYIWADEGDVTFEVGSWRDATIESLVKACSGLLKANRLWDSGRSKMVFRESVEELNGILKMLEHNRTSSRKLPNKTKVVNTDMCQEKFVFKRIWQGEPHFREGLQIENCKGVPKLHTLLTVVYNFVHYGEEDLRRVNLVMQEVNKLYPGVQIIAAVPSSSSITLKKFNNTIPFMIPASTTGIEVWNKLIAEVKTKYVYIGRNVVHFTSFDRLERLVREVNNLKAVVVAGAFRTLRSGIWTTGCEQSLLRNYTLRYRQGYSKSVEECMVCDHVQGPFVVKTKTFTKFPLNSKMTEVSGFAKWFLDIKKSEKNVVVCPDSMAFVCDNSREPTTKTDWLPLARSLQVERVYPTEKRLIEFSCEEANTSCSKVQVTGMALSACCLREMTKLLRYITNECLTNSMMCQLADVALLGAVKFNSVLPWQRDTGLTLHKDNYTAFAEKLKPKLTQLGYDWQTKPEHYLISTSHWTVKVSTLPKMAVEMLRAEGLSPTIVSIDGVDAPAPDSPGLYCRNRYGSEIYQHWAQAARSPKTRRVGRFPECATPGHHACLNQYMADGSLMFKDLV